MNKSLEEIKALVIDRIEEYLLHLLPGGEFYKSNTNSRYTSNE